MSSIRRRVSYLVLRHVETLISPTTGKRQVRCVVCRLDGQALRPLWSSWKHGYQDRSSIIAALVVLGESCVAHRKERIIGVVGWPNQRNQFYPFSERCAAKDAMLYALTVKRGG